MAIAVRSREYDDYYSMEERMYHQKKMLLELTRMIEDNNRMSLNPLRVSTKMLQPGDFHHLYVDPGQVLRVGEVALDDPRETQNIAWVDGRASSGPMWTPPTDKKAELEKERKRKIHALWAQRHLKSKAT